MIAEQTRSIPTGSGKLPEAFLDPRFSVFEIST
jgi:hypothetical protein